MHGKMGILNIVNECLKSLIRLHSVRFEEGLIGWNNGAADSAVLGWTCRWTRFIVKLGPRFKCEYQDP